jgi:acetylglutamate/LysW-gamma-L-alpha-aminoadipate kinase
LVTKLTLDEAKNLLPKIGPGMEKKVLASTEAISIGVKKAIIASGAVQNPIKMALENKDCTVIS